MKHLARALALSLVSVAALSAALPAQADRGGHGYRGGHGAHKGQHVHGHHRGHGGHGGVWAPLIVGGLIGAAIVGSGSAYAQPVQPVVVAPPQPVPPRVQYFCAPYRAYYPFVTNCPEPWYILPY